MSTKQISHKEAKSRERLKQANTKVALVVVAAITKGLMSETQERLQLDKAEELKQVQRVSRWSLVVLDGLPLGSKAAKEATRLIKAIDMEIKKYAPAGSHKNVGHFAIVWLAVGFLADEAKLLAPEGQVRDWNFLASTVNTWVAMLLKNSPKDRDYEGQAGELADRVWQLVFDKPPGSFGKL